jgi:light-regulated signal transduction histidine kinase (bacteriophytochrome)
VNGKTFFDERGNAYRFVGTILDITEQKKFSEELESRIALRTQELKVANDELMQINNKLEKSNRELESFTYIASHDLQEPLRKILFFSDFIQKNSKSLNGMESYFNKISVSTQRMSDLITSLLQYSTISNSQDSFISVDLNLVMQNIYEDYEILIQETGATISTAPLPVVFGNGLQMFQLFANLISNALKFSEKQPQIKISYKLVTTTVPESGPHKSCHAYHEISVADNGIGFDQQYNDQIFIIFQRLHGRKDFPGMGLGLAICKKILENHLGTIRASSIPGQGSEFIVSLPV